MNKTIVILIVTIIILAPTITAVSATSIFLTSDSIFGQKGEEVKMLNEIKDDIEKDSNGTLNVTIDPNAPAPSEGTRAMESNSDVSVTFAFADAANFYELAKYSTKVDKQIIYVNTGSLDLNSLSQLRRAWDDNWSDQSFASLKNPGQFLSEAGIAVIQPTKAHPENTDNDGDMYYSDNTKNKYIADEIINAINNNNSSSRTLDTNLVNTNQLDVSTIGNLSQAIKNTHEPQLKESYGKYSTPQALYLLSSYLYGDPLKEPKDYKAPNNPQNYSIGAKSNYSLTDYENMSEIVVNYMNEYNQAPDYINYKGAKIGYNDLIYNFAILTSDDVDSNHMNLPASSSFQSYNNNILYTAIPIFILIGVILLIIGIIHKRKR